MMQHKHESVHWLILPGHSAAPMLSIRRCIFAGLVLASLVLVAAQFWFNLFYQRVKPRPLLQPVCGCSRHFQLRTSSFNDTQNLRSTCGPGADFRGPHQRVLSFSFFGDIKSNYFLGVARNADAIARLYPGWLMRLYHFSSPTNREDLQMWCDVMCAYPFLDDCFVGNLESRLGTDLKSNSAMLWRFVVLGDPLVDVFVSRDLDSTVYRREVDAVDEWLRSNRTWHVMRDHPFHVIPMLGGMWGVKNADNVTKMAAIRDTILKADQHAGYGHDQNLLQFVVFEEANKSLLAHDSFHCKEFSGSSPFPSQRINKTFVGDAQERRPDWIINQACPSECRPPGHQDWIYC